MTAPDSAAERPMPVSATVLTARGLTPGKYRGLQRITHPGGTLALLALDQSASMIPWDREALPPDGHDRVPTYHEIVEAQIDRARHLAPAVSGVLLDSVFGAWPVIASGAVPPATGLLVRLDRSVGPRHTSGLPLSQVEPGWSVEKIKLLGADALRLLLPFDPFEPQSAEIQLAFLERVAADCRRFDLLFLLETISVPLHGLKTTDAAFLDRKPAVVIETARLLSRHADLYAAEFPGTLDREPDPQLEDNLQALSAATERPWVLRSSGDDFETDLARIEMSVEAGASGILGGRAFWHDSAPSRTDFAQGKARDRVAQVDALVRDRATPWFDRYGLAPDDLAAIRPAEGWHIRHAPHAEAAPPDHPPSSTSSPRHQGDLF